jgi:hypothetical protein
MNITVAIFIDRYGDATIRAFTTPEMAEDWRQDIAASWWAQNIGDAEAEPDTRAARADRYLEIMGDRRGVEFSVETVELEGGITVATAVTGA